MFRQTMTIVSLGLFAVLLVLGTVVCATESQQAQSQSAQSQQTESGKGLTVEDLSRGVRSAVQNIEKEIPKMGAAVGNAIKSVGANSSKKKQDRPQPPDNK